MVQWVAVALALAVAVLQAPPASAQDAAGPEGWVAVDDPAGDTQGPTPKEGAGFLDVTRAEAAATEAGLEVRVTVASLQTDPLAITDWELWLAFEYRGARFDAVVLPTTTTVDRPDEADQILFGDIRAFLWDAVDGEQVAPLATAADVPGRTFNATVPWELIVEPGGNSPSSGEAVRIVEGASAWTPILLGTP